MDFDDFISKIGSPKLPPLVFHLLEHPLMIRDHLRSKYSVFALAWTGRQGESDNYVYALAITPRIGGYQLAVLRQFDCPSIEEPWYTTKSLFHRPWVQEWISSHPTHLINGAIMASKVNWR